jgi:hypothetical protein
MEGMESILLTLNRSESALQVLGDWESLVDLCR